MSNLQEQPSTPAREQVRALQQAFAESRQRREGIATATGGIGLIRFAQGDYAQALECRRRKLEIAREMGDPRRISTAAGDIGNIHAAQGDHGSALECYHSALKGSRAIGFPTGVTAWLHGSATVLVDLFTSCREMHEYLSSYLPDTNEDAPCADRCRPGRSGYRIRIEDRILCNVASTSVISHTRKASRCAK